MSITAISNFLGTPSLAGQLPFAVDANRDRPSPTPNLAGFIAKLFSTETDSATAARAGAAPSTTSSRVTPLFKGFDVSRTDSAVGSLKYDAYDVLQGYDPRNPTAMKSAFAVLSAMHPSQYELDAQDNLMLTGTADGYIGARPFNRESNWADRSQDWSWDCMEYNVVHPGPNGEGRAPGM